MICKMLEYDVYKLCIYILHNKTKKYNQSINPSLTLVIFSNRDRQVTEINLSIIYQLTKYVIKADAQTFAVMSRNMRNRIIIVWIYQNQLPFGNIQDTRSMFQSFMTVFFVRRTPGSRKSTYGMPNNLRTNVRYLLEPSLPI